MDTLPMALDDLAGLPGGLDEFRIVAPREIAAMFKRLVDANVTLNLNAGDGSVVSSVLWTADAEHGSIGFGVEADDPAVQRLLDLQEAVAVGYLDAVKLQFEVIHPVLVRGPRSCVLRCDYPHELYRFQRRSAYRVRPPLRSTPMARLRPAAPSDAPVLLRVLDVSISGCALFLPDELATVHPGALFSQVRIELDADTRFETDLRLQHITSLEPATGGVRLGCEFVRAGGDALRALQRFIEQTQKRGKLLALG